MRMHPCMRTHATVQKLLCHGSYLKLILSKACASIMQAVVCRSLLQPLLLSRPNPSPDAVRLKKSCKSTLAHDAVAAVVSHKHHLIIRVGAGLIQFVYGSHSRRLGHGVFSTIFNFHHSCFKLGIIFFSFFNLRVFIKE